MDKKLTIFAVLALSVLGLVGWGLANQAPPVVNVSGPTINVPPTNVSVQPANVSVNPTIGAFESGATQFDQLGQGVLRMREFFISSASFKTLDTTPILALATQSDGLITQFLGAFIDSNPASEAYTAFGGINIYVKDVALENIVASVGNFVALGSGSVQRSLWINPSVCQNGTGVAYVCPKAGAFKNVASKSAFYLKESIENNGAIGGGGNSGGDTSFWVKVYYRLIERK